MKIFCAFLYPVQFTTAVIVLFALHYKYDLIKAL
jgi:hypothetical protein